MWERLLLKAAGENMVSINMFRINLVTNVGKILMAVPLNKDTFNTVIRHFLMW